MSGMSRRLMLLAGLLVLVALSSGSPAGAAGVPAKAGDIFYVNTHPGARGIMRVKPKHGHRDIVSDNTLAGSPSFDHPFWLAVEADGDLVTTGTFVQSNGLVYEGVIRVDPITGVRSAVSLTSATAGISRGGGPFFEGAWGIAVESTGNLLVVNEQTGDILRVDPNSGNRTIMSTNATAPQKFVAAEDIALAPDGHPHVADCCAFPAPGGSGGAVFRLDPLTGSHFLLSSNLAPAAGTQFDHPYGLAVDSSYNTYVGNRGPTRENIAKVDPAGVRTVIADNFFPGPDYQEINDVTLGNDEKAVISTHYGTAIGQLLKTRLSDGRRTLITDDVQVPGPPSTGDPWGVVVYPVTVSHFTISGRIGAVPPHADRASAARSKPIGTFSYRVKQRAKAVITITRRKGHTFKIVGKLKQDARAGKNRRAFSGKFHKHKLPAGTYRAILNLTDAAGNRSVPVSVDFKIA